MAGAREIPIQVGIFDRSFDVVSPTGDIEFSTDELTLLHINTGELTFSPMVIVHRKVPMVNGCSMKYLCTVYGETCDTMFLPPGEYEIELCDDNGAKYSPDGIFDMSLILEPVSNTYALAEQLNCGC